MQKRTRPARGETVRQKTSDTSWENSSQWYDSIIGEDGSDLYQQIVIPGALRLLNVRKDSRTIDIGCGQGVFARALSNAGSRVTGIDLSPSLIEKARRYPAPKSNSIEYFHMDSAKLNFPDGSFEFASNILSLQNMEHPEKSISESARVLKSNGRLLWVINHPCFRIPRQTSWGFDEGKKMQYRRVDAYMSSMRIPIQMHPGKKNSENTFSFHSSLQDLFSLAFKSNLYLCGLEEWISPKKSQPGKNARSEDRARAEFPLFMAVLFEKK